MPALEKQLKKRRNHLCICSIWDRIHLNGKLSRNALSGRPQSPSLPSLSPCIIHLWLYLQPSKNWPVKDPRECLWHISICQVHHLIWCFSPPYVQTRHWYYASSADRKQDAGKLKRQETKDVAGDWKKKMMCSPAPGVRGHVACHLGVLVRSEAVMMSCAGPVQNRVKGTGLTGS